MAPRHILDKALAQGYVHVTISQSYIDSLLSTVKRARLFTAQRRSGRSVTFARAVSQPYRFGERTDGFTLAQMFAAGGAIGSASR